MAIDFSLPSEVEDQRLRIAEFIRAVVLPAEGRAFGSGVDDALRRVSRSQGARILSLPWLTKER